MKTKTRGRVPAFLECPIRERSKTSVGVPTWTPGGRTKSVLTALEALPRLTAAIGMSAAAPDAEVEVLPGYPTTIAFTAGGKLRGLFVVPVDEDQARRTLGLPPSAVRDIAAERLWEEDRRDQYAEA